MLDPIRSYKYLSHLSNIKNDSGIDLRIKKRTSADQYFTFHVQKGELITKIILDFSTNHTEKKCIKRNNFKKSLDEFQIQIQHLKRKKNNFKEINQRNLKDVIN